MKHFGQLKEGNNIPYSILGHSVVKSNTGEVVGHSNNPKKYLHTLQAIEHGWTPIHHKKKKKHKGERMLGET